MFSSHLASVPLLAYVGPGLGLGTLIIIAALALSLVLAAVAVVWYPLKRLWRRLKGKDDEPRDAD